MIQIIRTNKGWRDKDQDLSRILGTLRTTKADSRINLVGDLKALGTKQGLILFLANPRLLSRYLRRAKKDLIRIIACMEGLRMDNFRAVATSIKTGINNHNLEGRRQRCIAKGYIWVDLGRYNNSLITLVLDLEEITTMSSRKEPLQGWL